MLVDANWSGPGRRSCDTSHWGLQAFHDVPFVEHDNFIDRLERG